MPSLSRRGFLVLGGTGAAGVALGACGSAEDPRSNGDDPELLATAIAAETNYSAAARFADQQSVVSQSIADASAARVDELASLPEATRSGPPDGAPEVTAAATAVIAAYRQGARLLSTAELRTTATRFLAQVAAELATVRGLEGDDPVPYAFVTGLPEPPLETTDNAPDGERTTSTTDTSTTEEGG